MRSRPLREGYLLVDHRNSPGVPEKGIEAGSIHEHQTLTCGHCQSLVVLNPERTRDRSWCYNCNEYICDGCSYKAHEHNEPCSSFAKRIDNQAELIIQGGITLG